MKPLDHPLLTRAPVQVRPYRDSDRETWQTFVMSCPQATFFHRIEWRDLLQQQMGHRPHYLLAERDRAIVGVLPLAQTRSLLFGHALSSLPFAAECGAAAQEAEVISALHAAAAALARDLDVQHLELRNSVAREPAWPRQSLYAAFRRPLLPEPETNLNAIPRKQRAMVRKGIERGLRAQLDGDVQRFFALYADNVHRHGTPPLARRWFAALKDAFGADCELLIVCDAAGSPISGVLSFYFRGTVLPYYAGDFPAARALAANDFKYWALMQRALERGCTVFDYGRSKVGTGPYDFKRNWGFTPTPLHYEYLLLRREAVPQNNPLNPRYRALIATWRRLPRPIVNLVGPHLVRHLG